MSETNQLCRTTRPKCRIFKYLLCVIYIYTQYVVLFQILDLAIAATYISISLSSGTPASGCTGGRSPTCGKVVWSCSCLSSDSQAVAFWGMPWKFSLDSEAQLFADKLTPQKQEEPGAYWSRVDTMYVWTFKAVIKSRFLVSFVHYLFLGMMMMMRTTTTTTATTTTTTVTMMTMMVPTFCQGVEIAKLGWTCHTS